MYVTHNLIKYKLYNVHNNIIDSSQSKSIGIDMVIRSLGDAISPPYSWQLNGVWAEM